ncbi:isocitrate lyase/phosphoenolpyruvate mutase family protein [Streptomyces sp. MC1]|uniref:isocitrate lyase/phosphoenolpyruvate mutase family protein n=1 Tax=Streptomyces sp. MC1 TaxID=295105 RepID=UPI001E60EA20|nr:isocitrate lyase/phosphoenolpyruvate mutase family protein [Streptomyces sp. MC1]
MRSAVDAAKGRIVVTGRTDNFLQGRPDLDDAIRRLTAFAEAGADVLCARYPPDLDGLIAIVTAVAPTPVTIRESPADKVLTVGALEPDVKALFTGGSPPRRLGTMRTGMRNPRPVPGFGQPSGCRPAQAMQWPTRAAGLDPVEPVLLGSGVSPTFAGARLPRSRLTSFPIRSAG